MIPQQNHPLTLAYVAWAGARTHGDMGKFMRLVRSLETDAPQVLRDQCKLAADVLVEREMQGLT